MASIGLARHLEDRDGSTASHLPVKYVADFQRLRVNLYALMLLVDGASMISAFLIADVIRHGRLEGYGINTFMVLFPTYLAVALNGDIWSIASLQRPRHSAASAVRALLFALSIATVFFFSLKVGAEFSRLVFGIGSCIALLAIVGCRLVLGQAIGRRYGWRFRNEVLIVDGVPALPANGQAVIDARREGLQRGPDEPAALDRLRSFSRAASGQSSLVRRSTARRGPAP